jgi:multidrug efflux pump subunit AcrA (membrane-fusion protein)
MNKLLAILFLILSISLLSGTGCTSQTEAEPTAETKDAPFVLEVDLIRLKPAVIEANLELIGTMFPVRTSTLAAETDGRIESFCLSDRKVSYLEDGQIKQAALTLSLGHPVKKGQVVCQIDPTETLLTLESAKADLELSRRNHDDLLAWKRPEEIVQLEASCEEAVASYDRASCDLKRSETLLKKKTIPKADYDQAVMAHRTAAAIVKHTKAALNLAKAGPTKEQVAVSQARIKQAESQVKREEENLKKTSIRAPYDGVVVERFLGVGDRVITMPQTDVLRIIDASALFAQIAVSERFQHMVQVDNPVQIIVPGTNKMVESRVDLVNEMVDPKTRTFRIRIALDNRNRLFKAGSFVNVRLPIRSNQKALVVPKIAVIMTDGNPSVFVLEGDHVVRQPIRLGIGSRTAWEVVEGLSSGQQVVANRPGMLSEGMRVKPKL